MYSCQSASFAVILSWGLIFSILSSKSNAILFGYLINVSDFYVNFSGNELIYFRALSLVINFKRFSSGLPK